MARAISPFFEKVLMNTEISGSPMLPFEDAPLQAPRHSVRTWAGLFPAHRPPAPLNAVIIVYGCMSRKSGGREPGFTAVHDIIGHVMKCSMGIDEICVFIGRGNPLSVWPDRDYLTFLYRELLSEWEFMHRSSGSNVSDENT